jgi:hypothetical protein
MFHATSGGTGSQLLQCNAITLKMEVTSYIEILAVSTKLLDITSPKTVANIFAQYFISQSVLTASENQDLFYNVIGRRMRNATRSIVQLFG